MKRKIMSILMLLSVVPMVIFSAGFSLHTVVVKNGSETVIESYYSSSNITRALKRAFEYTRKNAGSDNPLTICVEKGSYDVKETLYLTSYTTLDLGGARLINSNKKRGNIFKSPKDKPYPGYSSLKDCIIKNGTLDGNYNKNRSCMLRLCHCENILIENVTFLNNYYSHHAELAASKNVTFKNCAFSGQVSDLNISSSEAIQIDILDPVHFYGFTSYDNTMNCAITVEGCTFKNVYRGVGTHNYFKDLYQKDIRITDCVFENITDCAISAVNFENVFFKNNDYINCKYSVFSRDNGK